MTVCRSFVLQAGRRIHGQVQYDRSIPKMERGVDRNGIFHDLHAYGLSNRFLHLMPLCSRCRVHVL